MKVSRCKTETMSSPSARFSPSYRNLRLNKLTHSPIELKEKMRKDYKDKIKNCRNLLLNKMRGTVASTELHNQLTSIYKSMFDFSQDLTIEDEELKVLEEIRNDLVQEEFDWWIQEYDKCSVDHIDWSQIEQEYNVICPVCQRHNVSLQKNYLDCINCSYKIQTTKSLVEIKKYIEDAIEKHDKICFNEAQFNLVSEFNEDHIYLICDGCNDMQLII